MSSLSIDKISRANALVRVLRKIKQYIFIIYYLLFIVVEIIIFNVG